MSNLGRGSFGGFAYKILEVIFINEFIEIVEGNNTLVELYTSKLMQIADEYIHIRFNDQIKDFKKSMFIDLLLYIKDRIDVPSTDEIEKLDSLFDSYARLCARMAVRPTLYAFAILTNIDASTFSDWAKGMYRTNMPAYSQSAKRWKAICEGFLADALINSDGSSANMIFALKANYGWQETSPIPSHVNTNETLSIDSARKSFDEFMLKDNSAEND